MWEFKNGFDIVNVLYFEWLYWYLNIGGNNDVISCY